MALGILISITLLVSMCTNLILLPAILLSINKKELLEELDACAGEIDDSNYSDAQRQLLFKLMRKRPQLAVLRWVITPEGRKELMRGVIDENNNGE